MDSMPAHPLQPLGPSLAKIPRLVNGDFGMDSSFLGIFQQIKRKETTCWTAANNGDF